MAEGKHGTHFETLAIHAGQAPDPTTGAIMTPIFQSSTYVQASPGVHKGYEYSRTRNPTRTALEDCLAALEGAKHGLAFSSGCAATTTILHLLVSGDHVVCFDDVYGGTFRILDKVAKPLGIRTTFVDLSQEKKLEEAIESGTKLLWIETPTNPMLKLCDIRRCTDLARKKGIISVVDNTFMSPYFQQPLALGADIVVHSTTKYINGHSDVVGGFLATNRADLAERLAFFQNAMGGVPGPMDSWLVLRGVKTLAVRMQRHAENAMRVAKFLQEQSAVESVIYPGLSSHPQHNLAKSQMSGFGGMITAVLKGGLDRSRTFLERVKIFSLAESLGGVESLIEHPAIMTHASVPPEARKSLGIVDGLVRLSVGIENIDDLLDDLRQALR